MQPLVLAIEPDLRQAAIVKRIVREKVLADVAVVNSRDAALEAMRKTVPDVLLLSALLSPRDEDELFAHLRTLQDAEHLQTHTIPQLASSIDDDDEDRPSGGLLSAFRRRKGSAKVTAGCDPDLFADEIRTYLKRASDKKREKRASGPSEPRAPIIAPKPAAAQVEAAPAAEPAGSSWDSPFEWRPSRTTPAPRLEPPAEPAPSPVVVESIAEEPESPIGDPEPAFDDPGHSIFYPESPALEGEPAIADVGPVPEFTYTEAADAPHVKYPLTMRHARGWWYEEQERRITREPDSELTAVLSSLAVPATIAGVTYAEGCRIRRVRLTAA